MSRSGQTSRERNHGRVDAFLTDHTDFLSHADTTSPLNTECAVCLEDITEHVCVKIVGIEGCTHMIGLECLQVLLNHHPYDQKLCPMCRTEWLPAVRATQRPVASITDLWVRAEELRPMRPVYTNFTTDRRRRANVEVQIPRTPRAPRTSGARHSTQAPRYIADTWPLAVGTSQTPLTPQATSDPAVYFPRSPALTSTPPLSSPRTPTAPGAPAAELSCTPRTPRTHVTHPGSRRTSSHAISHFLYRPEYGSSFDGNYRSPHGYNCDYCYDINDHYHNVPEHDHWDRSLTPGEIENLMHYRPLR